MRQFWVDLIMGFIVLTILTFTPIIIGIYIYIKKNGKEDKKIDQISTDFILIGCLIGIYWVLTVLNYLVYGYERGFSLEKIKEIFNMLIT